MTKIVKKLFPFISWWPFKMDCMKADFIAGLTVALVLIPQSMAYSELAGLPPWIGLYSAFLPVMIGAMWGSSHHLQTGPVAMTSLITATTLSTLAPPGSPEFIALAAILAFIVGIIRIMVSVCNLTFLINFLSKPVIDGFVNAGALIIACSQVSKIFGLTLQRDGLFLKNIGLMCADLGSTHISTLVIGVASVALLVLIKKYFPKIPNALIVVIVTTLAVYFLGLSAPKDADAAKQYVKIVGHVPAGLPSFFFQLPPVDILWPLIQGSLVISFVSFMEMCSVSKAIALQSKQKIDMKQELIGQGLSSISSGFSGAFPSSGSFSRSALNFAAGAKTGMSSVFTSFFVLLMLLFFTKTLYYLPKACLAAIIIVAVVKLLDFKKLFSYWKVSKADGFVGTLTFAATLGFAPNMAFGVIIGILLSIFMYLYKTMKPRVAVLGLHTDGTFRDADRHQLDIDEEMPIVRFDSSLYFANVSYFEDAILSTVNRFPNSKMIVVSCEAIGDIDASGIEMLYELVHNLKSSKVNLTLIGLKQHVYDLLVKSGVHKEIGEDNIFRTVHEVKKPTTENE